MTEHELLQKVTGGLNGPLKEARQLSSRFSTKPPAKEGLSRLSANPWSAHFVGERPKSLGVFSNPAKEAKYLALWLQLQDRILEFGGHHVIHPGLEEDLRSLLKRGQCWTGLPTNQPNWEGVFPVTMRRGEPNQCHANSCAYWEGNKDRDVFLATGYALHKDGAWYQHSWCIEVIAPGSVRVVESTVKAIAYYGFVLTEEESYDFASDNLW